MFAKKIVMWGTLSVFHSWLDTLKFFFGIDKFKILNGWVYTLSMMWSSMCGTVTKNQLKSRLHGWWQKNTREDSMFKKQSGVPTDKHRQTSWYCIPCSKKWRCVFSIVFFLRSTSAVIVLKVEHPYTIFALADSIIWFFQGQLSAWPGLIRIPWWQPASVLSVPVVQKTLRICQSRKCAHIAEGVAGWRCKVVPLDT